MTTDNAHYRLPRAADRREATRKRICTASRRIGKRGVPGVVYAGPDIMGLLFMRLSGIRAIPVLQVPLNAPNSAGQVGYLGGRWSQQAREEPSSSHEAV